MTIERDQFPIGMRVLIVDDDVTCLRVLETMLHKCQYHVTATSHAFTALDLLRENKNKFDLVISDVQMPDMDGFKLLELVGLEMDLPVIMLSSNGDHQLVMKGVTHGACDYLVKPVRIQELKNIWQHVIRRKKGDSKEQTSSGNQDKSIHINKKRKDQNEDEDEDGYDNDDPSAQKKPRVVWSVDLHRKFVAAVNKLGIDKAVPKKILDLMNEDKLTRENVASHLQKFRLYLRRISCVANQQANMMAAIGSSDSSYLRMNSFNGGRNYHAFTGAGQLDNPGFRSIPVNGMIGRANAPPGLGLHGLPSAGSLQGPILGRPQDFEGSSHIQDRRTEMLIQPSAAQILDNDSTQGWMWMDQKQDSSYHHSDTITSSVDSLIPVAFDHNLDSKDTALQRNMDFNSIGQSNFFDSLSTKFDEVERSMDAPMNMNLKAGYVMDQQGGLLSNNYGLLDDLLGAMTNQLEKR